MRHCPAASKPLVVGWTGLGSTKPCPEPQSIGWKPGNTVSASFPAPLSRAALGQVLIGRGHDIHRVRALDGLSTKSATGQGGFGAGFREV
jgi:hypothetical protein